MSGGAATRSSWSSRKRLIGAFAVGFIGALVAVTSALLLAFLILPVALVVGIVAALVRGDRYGLVVALAGSLAFMVVSAIPFIGDPQVELVSLLSFFMFLFAGAYATAFFGLRLLRLRQGGQPELPIEDEGWPDEPDNDPGAEPNEEPNPAD